MTPDEIINKWIGGSLPGDDAATRRVLIGIFAEMKADIQQAINTAVEEERERLTQAANIACERAIDTALRLENEACAKIADEVKVHNWSYTYSAHGGANLIAERIRARRNNGGTK